MDGFKGKWMVGKLMMINLMVVMTLMVECAVGLNPKLHKVGGTQGWNPNINYTEWSKNEHFYVGDWLYFGFDKHYYNVLQVNNTSYDKCIEEGFVKNITRGGRDVFELTEAKPYYFLSGRGYCYHGMKVAVFVQEIPPTPAPAPSKSASPPSSILCSSHIIISVVLHLALVWSILFIRSF